MSEVESAGKVGARRVVQTRVVTGRVDTTPPGELLVSLRASGSTGRLRLERDDVARDLYLRSGFVVGVDSNADTDSIEWLMLAAGVLSEERHERVRSLVRSGSRAGPALVEAGGISGAALCDWTVRRARFLARDVLTWKSGAWEFDAGSEPPAGMICASLDPREIILETLREAASSHLLAASMPPLDQVPAPAGQSGAPAGALHPHEAYVLSLADGTRRVSEICFLSELGETETLRALALLRLAGCFEPAGAGEPARQAAGTDRVSVEPADDGARDTGPGRPADLPPGETTAELRAVIRIYNDWIAFLFAHLIKEVGPIAEQLLEKHVREARDAHAAVFQRAIAARDGGLPEDILLRNVNMMKDQNRREVLLAALDDHLRAMVQAVRRILGPDHEDLVLRRLREQRCTRP